MKSKHCIVAPRELDTVLSGFPEVKQWDESTIAPADIFITTLGFEDRALRVSQLLASASISSTMERIPLALVGRYLTNVSANLGNESTLTSDLNKFCDQTLNLDADAPHLIAQELGSHIDSFLNKQEVVRIIFDLSAASGNFILSVMHTLLKRGNAVDLTIYYVEPISYYPLRSEYDNNLDGLTESCCAVGDPNSPHESGVEAVYVNELYTGFSSDNRPELVIAIPSFRTERLLNSLQFVSDQVQADPAGRVLWLTGMPYAEENRWRNDLQCRMIKRLMSSMVGAESLSAADAPSLNEHNCRIVSTLDYKEMIRTVIEVSDKHLGHKISLIHMGSKMQAIGLSLALHVRNEIAVCYARPARFNPDRYSQGYSTSWTIPFGLIGDWSNKLAQIGELALTTNIETNRTGVPTD